MKRLAAFAIGFGLLMLSPSGASAADTVFCSSSSQLPAGTYQNVDASFGCVLDEGHVIEGWLVLNPGSEYIEVSGTRIGGDVAAFGAVTLDRVHVDGSIYLLVGGTGTAVVGSYVGGDIWNQCGCIGSDVMNNQVAGSILLDGTGQEYAYVWGNVVGGDLSVHGFSGEYRIDDNQVGGDFRLTDTLAWQPVPSSVNANRVGGRFELSRNRVSHAFEADAGEGLTVSANVIEGHAGLFQNSEMEFVGNQIGGALVCSNNTALVQSGNTAHTRLGECTD